MHTTTCFLFSPSVFFYSFRLFTVLCEVQGFTYLRCSYCHISLENPTMRRVSRQLIHATTVAAATRFAATSGAKKYDLFGYEVDTNTAPWIEKIKKCKYYDEAGEVLVNMNVSNCPPDIATYNAALQRIYEAPSKQAQPVENESKFCAMLDLLEEMNHRNKMKPNEESWMWVMRECVKSGQFRLGYCIQKVMEAEFKSCPADLVKQNEANAERAKAEGKEHPSYLSLQVGLFDVKIE
ncbi:ribonucleoprotein p18, mitochondrial precursor, putative [Trypanosoma cruzi]|uniref:Ribonucleoprotein p18, mitochondrial, putative n=1 Tax=Trypanosoma cruzi (strain CL Brener) TaxID=353153 RepID=Q4CZG5_TRYCC|nr:ribonucleoprotein p18, mitochondrial precursor, putative [Trypanosoma cruzi]EAN85671.1 ribonucleoprotein p18, mitochondrial precursor, putative [Trypanosoma cruzi]|eukprot:XP_807522.1 ribonucleoprotein p18, mitochondrial precursor [Trypanosoma cruzi strain CL Brener]